MRREGIWRAIVGVTGHALMLGLGGWSSFLVIRSNVGEVAFAEAGIMPHETLWDISFLWFRLLVSVFTIMFLTAAPVLVTSHVGQMCSNWALGRKRDKGGSVAAVEVDA